MNGKRLGTCARRLVQEVATIKSMGVVVPVKQGDTLSEVRLRTAAKPERHVAELLSRLELELPKGNHILNVPPAAESKKQNVV